MVTKLLERAIEIEGLLRIVRDGRPFPEVYAMLQDKANSLAEEIQSLTDSSIESTAEVGVIDMTVDNSENSEIIKEDKEPEEENHEVEIKIGDSEEKIPDVEITIVEVAEGTGTPVHFDNPESEGNEEDDTDDDILLTFEEEEESVLGKELPSDTEGDPDEGKQQEGNKEDAVAKSGFKRQSKLKSAFSLNDRFLYSRELFEGNMKMFDSTLEFIDGIEDYSIIEDYFYNELEWDPENATVISFMEILRPQFRE